MATSPRKNTGRRRTAATKKPTTIDLEATEVTAPATASKQTAGSSGGVTSAGDAKSTQPQNTAASAKQTTKKTPASSGSEDHKPHATSVRSMDGASAKDASKPALKTGSPSRSAEKTIDKNKKPTDSKSDKTATASNPEIAGSKAQRKGGVVGHLAAGLVGGVVALGGAWGLGLGGSTVVGDGQVVSGNGDPAILQKLAAIAEDNKNLKAQLSALETQSAGVSSDGVSGSVISKLDDRLSALEGQIQSGDSPQGEAGVLTQIGELKKQMEALSSASSDNQNGGPEKLDRLETTLAKNSQTISNIKEAGKKLDQKIVELSGLIGAETGRIDDLEQGVGELKTQIRNELVSRVDKLSDNIKKVETGGKMAKAVARNAIRNAQERGEAFSAALLSLETIDGQSPIIDQLKPIARKGIPTAQQLLTSFRVLHSSMINAKPGTEDTTVMDQLVGGLRSLVTVRSKQPLNGDSVEAILSRIDKALQDRNFGAAKAQWGDLPESVKQVSKDWYDQLELRMRADGLLYQLLQAE